MALVNSISYSLTDYSGDGRGVRIFTPATYTLAEMQSLSDAIAAELDAITGMVIEGASVSLALTLPAGIKANATANVDAERGINWTMTVANSTYSHTVRTPGALDANVDGEDVVSDANVTDWITVLLDGDATSEPSDQFANDITALKASRVTFHK